MTPLICTCCGGNQFNHKNGHYFCTFCGTEYIPGLDDSIDRFSINAEQKAAAKNGEASNEADSTAKKQVLSSTNIKEIHKQSNNISTSERKGESPKQPTVSAPNKKTSDYDLPKYRSPRTQKGFLNNHPFLCFVLICAILIYGGILIYRQISLKNELSEFAEYVHANGIPDATVKHTSTNREYGYAIYYFDIYSDTFDSFSLDSKILVARKIDDYTRVIPGTYYSQGNRYSFFFLNDDSDKVYKNGKVIYDGPSRKKQVETAEAVAYYKDYYKDKLPVIGMPEDALRYTMLGPPTTVEKSQDFDHKVASHQYRYYIWKVDGKKIFTADVKYWDGKKEIPGVVYDIWEDANYAAAHNHGSLDRAPYVGMIATEEQISRWSWQGTDNTTCSEKATKYRYDVGNYSYTIWINNSNRVLKVSTTKYG